MTILKSKEEIVAWVASYVHRAVGYEVTNKQTDSLSCTLALSLKENRNSKIYIMAICFDTDGYAVSMVSQNNKDKESECMSLTVDYKQYFSKLEVPITEEQVDSMYDSPDLEWGDTLPGK